MIRSLVLLLVATPAFAQSVYRWVDKAGTTHYTDNPASIPQGATVFATEGEPISEMGKAPPLPVVAARPVAVEQKQQVLEADPSVPSHAEQYWRGQFRSARDKLRTLEDEITADRRRVEDPNGLPVGPIYACGPAYGYAPPVVYGARVHVGHRGVRGYVGQVQQPGVVNPFVTCIQSVNPEYERALARLQTNRGALERAKEDLRDLERRASFDAVPLEWRR